MTADTFHVGPSDDPDRYRLDEPIGAGAEGMLYRGYLPMASGPVLDVALKMLHPRHRPQLASWRRHWSEQVELLRSLQAQGLVTVRDGFVGALPHAEGRPGAGETLYLVMNFIDGVALDAWAEEHQGVSDRDKLRLLLPVAAGLDLMHSGVATGGVPVIHGDIKPGNVLVVGDRSVLVDFGMMRSLPGGTRTTFVTGTTGYLAPEVTGEGLYTPAADRYAFGGVAYHLLTGQHPSRDLAAMRAALQTGGRDPEVVNHLLDMFGEPGCRPAPLANWCAQLRDSSLDLRDDFENLQPTAPGRLHGPPPASVPGRTRLLVPAHRGLATRDTTLVTVEAAGVEPAAALLPSPNGAERRPRPGVRRRRPPLWLIGGLVAAVVGLAAGFPTLVPSTPPAPAAPVIFAFAPTVYPSGLVVAREWSLTGRRGTRLAARVRVTNGSSGVVSSSVDEVIPKTLAASTAAIRFLPPPDMIVRQDPVVRYMIRELEPAHAVDLLYDIPVPPDGARISRLQAWAAAQGADEIAYLAAGVAAHMVPVTLSSLDVSPEKASLVVGRTYQLSPAGTMSDGTQAPALVLANLVWNSSDPSVIGVLDGRITANEVGVATVSARTGSLRADVAVTVTTPEGGQSGPPAVLPAPTYQPPQVIIDPPPARVVTPPPPETTTTSLPAETTTTTLPAETTTTTSPPAAPRGTILVDVVTDPAGSTQVFEFAASYGANFTLTDAGVPSSSGSLPPGTHSLAEVNIPAGWDLTGAACSDGSPADTIDLGPAETVTCTFTNRQQGTILVDVVSDPAGSTQVFEFDPSYGENFTLTDPGVPHASGSLVPGTYSVVAVAIPAGWDLTGAACSDGSPLTTIDLGPAETVTCTFTTRQQGTILVDVVTDPAGSTQVFEFAPSYGANFTLTDAGVPSSSGSLPPGTYSLAEVNIPAGWDLTGAACSDGSPANTIDLGPAETVTCTFTYTQTTVPT